MLHKEIPFLRICVPLIAGIITGYLIESVRAILIILCITIICGFIVSLFFNNRITNIVFGIIFSISVFTCGLILYNIEQNSITDLDQESTVFYSVVKDFPEKKDKSVMVTVKLKKILNGETASDVRGSLVLYHSDDSVLYSLIPGDILIMRCTPLAIRNQGNPDEFNYRFFMERRETRYYAFTGREDIISHTIPGSRNLRYMALILRERIINMYEKRGIGGDHLAIVAAITLGEKSLLDNDQKQNFIKAGVTHIMAVSGLHAIILSMFVLNILFFMKGRFNTLRIIIAIIILWAFAFVTGLTPSVLRAALMFSFLQAGYLMKRRVNGINSVLASAFVLILIKPSVIFEAGFLLSYAAVLYIIGFYNELHNLFTFSNRFAERIWQAVAVTLIAQAGTLPLVIMLFNRFPVWFILSNVLVVPLASFLIIGGCLIPLTFPLFPLSYLIGRLLDRLAGIIEMVTTGVAGLPLSTIDNIGVTPGECLFLTLSISLSLYYLLKRPSISIKYPLMAILFFSLSLTINHMASARCNQLIVYNTPDQPSIGIQTGKVLNIYSENKELAPAVLRHSAVRRLKISYNKLSGMPILLKTGDYSILITDSIPEGYRTGNNNENDVIILTGPRPYIPGNVSIAELLKCRLITSQASPGFRITREYMETIDGEIWSVRKSGACLLDLRSQRNN